MRTTIPTEWQIIHPLFSRLGLCSVSRSTGRSVVWSQGMYHNNTVVYWQMPWNDYSSNQTIDIISKNYNIAISLKITFKVPELGYILSVFFYNYIYYMYIRQLKQQANFTLYQMLSIRCKFPNYVKLFLLINLSIWPIDTGHRTQ